MFSSLSDEEFESLVAEAIDGLPEEIGRRLSNVEIVVADDHPEEHVDENLLGLYEGIPLTERTSGYFGILPDRITLFKRNLERISSSPEELRNAVRRTVVHEVAHHFGISDERLEELGWD